MNKIAFTDVAWSDYAYWQTQDRKTLKRINALIDDIKRNPYGGAGKPEPLSGNLSGCWSRRIDDKNRIIYRVVDDSVEFLVIRKHYGD